MNRIDFFTKIYSQVRHYSGVPFWVLTPVRRSVRWWANKLLPQYLSKPYRESAMVIKNMVVSFTSFPARISNVWQVVECMLHQTYLPEKIILWLSMEQFPSEDFVPESLRCRRSDRFDIRFVEGDIRSHKKYYYVLKEFPESFIFLIDDDIYYPTDLIEKSWKAHLAYPNRVICNYGYQIRYDTNDELLPYKKWIRSYRMMTEDIFFGSGGGTLLSSSMLFKDVTNINLAQKLTPIADDIWLNAMANLAGIQKILLSNGMILPTNIKDNIKLASQNRDNDQNDVQLDAVIRYYKQELNINPFSKS